MALHDLCTLQSEDFHLLINCEQWNLNYIINVKTETIIHFHVELFIFFSFLIEWPSALTSLASRRIAYV